MTSRFRKTLARVETIRVELEAAEGAEGEESFRPAIVLHVAPISSADVQLATMAVAARLGQAADGEEAKARYGFASGDDVSALNLTRIGESGATMLAVELGIRHIRGWEGLGGPDGEAAPVTPEGVMLLLTDWHSSGRSNATVFVAKALGQSILEDGAKKGSAASPATSLGEAASIAANAATPGTPAQSGGA